MIDVRSEKKEVQVERRQHPRLELHCDTTVPGLKGIHTLTDISFGGCFIEAKISGKVKLGQIITLKTKLPTERNEIEVKAKIVSQRERGIGCQFISLQDKAKDAICLCFEMYKDTLPAGSQEAQWENECLETMPEVLPPESKIDIKPSPLREISETSQTKSVKSQGQHRMLLKVGIGLTVVFVLLAGYLLAKIIFHTSPEPDPSSDAGYAVVAPQRHTVKIQAKSIESLYDNDKKEAQNVQPSQIEEENNQSQNVGLTQAKSLSPTEAEPIEIVSNPLAPEEKTSTVALKKTPDLESSGTNDQKLLNLETETTANIPINGHYSIEIGPIYSKRDLKEVMGFLHDNGFDPEKRTEMGTVKVIRLFEGSYTRDIAQDRLKEIQKTADSAFVIAEKGKLSIYVATYYDRDEALEKSKQLAKNNIKVIAVPTEIKLKGTKLLVEKVEQPDISNVQDQMSKIGLLVKILKSN